MAVPRPAELADQLWLMIDGALMNASLLAGSDPARTLESMARSLVAAARDLPGA
jgi:hypothetical protein